MIKASDTHFWERERVFYSNYCQMSDFVLFAVDPFGVLIHPLNP